MARGKILSARQCPECNKGIAYTIQVGDEQFVQCKTCQTTYQDESHREYTTEEIEDVLIVTFKENEY